MSELKQRSNKQLIFSSTTHLLQSDLQSAKICSKKSDLMQDELEYGSIKIELVAVVISADTGSIKIELVSVVICTTP